MSCMFLVAPESGPRRKSRYQSQLQLMAKKTSGIFSAWIRAGKEIFEMREGRD